MYSSAAQWRSSGMYRRMIDSVYSGPGAAIRRNGEPHFSLPNLNLQLPGMVNLDDRDEERLLQDALLSLKHKLHQKTPQLKCEPLTVP